MDSPPNDLPNEGDIIAALFNQNHDDHGRFSSGGGPNSGAPSGEHGSSAHDNHPSVSKTREGVPQDSLTQFNDRKVNEEQQRHFVKASPSISQHPDRPVNPHGGVTRTQKDNSTRSVPLRARVPGGPTNVGRSPLPPNSRPK